MTSDVCLDALPAFTHEIYIEHCHVSMAQEPCAVSLDNVSDKYRGLHQLLWVVPLP